MEKEFLKMKDKNNIYQFKLNNVEIDKDKLARETSKKILLEMGLNELQATAVMNALSKIIEANQFYWMKQGVIEFLGCINEQTDEEFEEFVQGLRLGRQESRKG